MSLFMDDLVKAAYEMKVIRRRREDDRRRREEQVQRRQDQKRGKAEDPERVKKLDGPAG